MAEIDELIIKNVILNEKKVVITEDIAFFRHKASELIHKMSLESAMYPECHNDPTKKECDFCMNCWSRECNRSNCDRLGRCLCERTDCICLGRHPQ